MSRMPVQKQALPRHLLRRAKKSNVREGPRRRVMPIRKRMLPIASRARSKKKRRPKRMKRLVSVSVLKQAGKENGGTYVPPAQKATAISVAGH